METAGRVLFLLGNFVYDAVRALLFVDANYLVHNVHAISGTFFQVWFECLNQARYTHLNV